MRKSFLILALIVVVLGSTIPASAQYTSPILRAGIIGISPDGTSPHGDTFGVRVELDTGIGADVAVSYPLRGAFSLDLGLGVAYHKVKGEDLVSPTYDLGKVWSAPLSLLIQWQPTLYGKWHPYVGVGGTYTAFFAFKIETGLPGDVDFSGAFGPTFQLGLDIDAGLKWFVNFDVRYTSVEVDVDIKGPDDVNDRVKLPVNPLTARVGFGYRF
ncbi:MAG: OmpW family protein [bacterium]|nr:OmpW family protein [bacterium]